MTVHGAPQIAAGVESRHLSRKVVLVAVLLVVCCWMPNGHPRWAADARTITEFDSDAIVSNDDNNGDDNNELNQKIRTELKLDLGSDEAAQGRSLDVDPAPARGLSTTFYASSCPSFQDIVAKHVAAAIAADAGRPPQLMRMVFHDAFVQGMDASVLLAPTSSNDKTEKTAVPNLSLVGFDTINDIKADLETACPQTVSCADILVAAAGSALPSASGPSIDFKYGRRDGLRSTAAEANRHLPKPFGPFSFTLGVFAGKGFTAQETVALSGAHTFGKAHCPTFGARLYGNATDPTTDPTLKPSYARTLKSTCPTTLTNAAVLMDPETPNTFDNQYYKNLRHGKGLFSTDEEMAFYLDSGVKDLVDLYAEYEGKWIEDFVKAFVKLSELEVLTGPPGQIRLNCSFVNAADSGETSASS